MLAEYAIQNVTWCIEVVRKQRLRQLLRHACIVWKEQECLWSDLQVVPHISNHWQCSPQISIPWMHNFSQITINSVKFHFFIGQSCLSAVGPILKVLFSSIKDRQMCFFTLLVFSLKANHSIRKESELQLEVSCLNAIKLTPVIVGAGAEDKNIVAVFPSYTLAMELYMLYTTSYTKLSLKFLKSLSPVLRCDELEGRWWQEPSALVLDPWPPSRRWG